MKNRKQKPAARGQKPEIRDQMGESLTGITRRHMKAMGLFRADDVMNGIGVSSYADAKRIRSVIQQLRKDGEIRSETPGYYRYIGRQAQRNHLDVIWHLARSHRRFDTDEIERLSGAKRGTVLEYLNCLLKLGYIQKTGWQAWKLVRDPGPKTPVNTGKCARLKRIRMRKDEN